MAKQERDYKAEYERRIARALAKGLSKSQARGHPKPREQPTRARKLKPLDRAKLQLGLKILRQEKSFTKAAKAVKLSPERLRSYAAEKGIVEKHGRRWVFKLDLTRRVLVFSDGQRSTITVNKDTQASRIGEYMNAVRRFLETNNRKHLKPFVGKSVTDADGKKHLLETRSNTLYRLAHTGGSSFEQVYRIVV